MEADMGLTNMAFEGSNARYAADETLLVRFFKHARKNEGKSAEEGRPIFEETDYIQIMQPGNKDSIIVRPATEMDKNRFSEHWNRYQTRNSDEEHIEGTLLTEWPGITRSQAEELKHLNIRTVEQLANASDSNIQNYMGVAVLKQKAKNYLEAAKDEATAEALAAANAKIGDQESLINDLSRRLAELEEASGAEEEKKPTRRRRKATEE